MVCFLSRMSTMVMERSRSSTMIQVFYIYLFIVMMMETSSLELVDRQSVALVLA